ncbi:tumor necrosis factor receptor superfamily member 6B-like [Erythrolamprus reginae]|uniref:tumor necrosis factor receptor superfamily member 6B-like n=1 Tax=Erythrolamprus reginae TaxID=121349 RepID=UPI00396C5F33
MPNLCQWTIWSIFLWSTLTHASWPKFEWEDPDTQEKLFCHECLAGTKMVRPCTADTFTECQPCGDDTYTEHFNHLDRCLSCSSPCDVNAMEVQPCTMTHDRACECKPGYHKEYKFCIKHLPCLPGSGVVKPGTPQKDTECRDCPEGTFSSDFSTKATCQTHKDCAKQGLSLNVPGNIFHDTYCTSCKPNKGSESGTVTEDCYEAALDFVPFQLDEASLQQLQSLYHSVTPPGRKKNKKNRTVLELQTDLHSYLLQLKNLTGKEQAWNTIKAALAKMKLEHILQEVRKRFSVG